MRWSNGGGNPKVPDPAPDVRGMAVKFRQPDGSATDLLGQTSPRFPTDSPEVFVQLTEAANKPWLLPLFLARHPGVLPTTVASARAKAVGSPRTFAEVTFYPIHAYGWLAADGTRTWVRYIFRPTATRADRLDETFEGRDRLAEEIAARLARGPGHPRGLGAGRRRGARPAQRGVGLARRPRAAGRPDRRHRRGARPRGWTCLPRHPWSSTRPGWSTASSSPTTRSCATGPAAYSESVSRRMSASS